MGLVLSMGGRRATPGSSKGIIKRDDFFKVTTETSRVWLLLGAMRGDATVGDGESGEDQVWQGQDWVRGLHFRN